MQVDDYHSRCSLELEPPLAPLRPGAGRGEWDEEWARVTAEAEAEAEAEGLLADTATAAATSAAAAAHTKKKTHKRSDEPIAERVLAGGVVALATGLGMFLGQQV